MKIAHLIKVSVFSHEDEEESEIKKGFLSLFPFNLDEEKIGLNERKVKGLEQKMLYTFEAELKKDRHINAFLKNLIDGISSEDKERIIRQAESRLNDELDFYLRFDIKEYLANKKFKLVEHGHCFHIKISVAAFPAKREKALNIVKELFK